MNLNKQDFSMAVLAVGMAESMDEAENVGVQMAGKYVTSSDVEQRALLEVFKESATKSIAMMQQLNEKLDAELASMEGQQ